jgi:heavy metal sensor kinase
MKNKSLQKTLFFNYVLSIFLGFTLFSLTLFWLLTSGLYKKVDNTLTSEADWIENFMKENLQYGENYVFEEIDEHISPDNQDLALIILNRQNQVVFQTDNLINNNFLLPWAPPQSPPATKETHIFSTEVDQKDGTELHLRVLTRKISIQPDGNYYLKIALDINDVEAVQRQLLFWLLIIIPLIGVPFALWSKYSARQIARPLEFLSQRARRITINQLSEKIEIPPSYREVEDLTQSFNEMIQRLNKSIAGIKRFTSDASHELRTPLAVLKSQIQVALREKKLPTPLLQFLQDELNEVAYMEKIVDNLLLLSRYDAHKISLEKTVVDFSDLVIEQTEKKKELAREHQVELQLLHIEPTKILGDRLYLSQMISNLLDNAIKYNRPGGRVEIKVETTPQNRCQFTVKDTGLGIPSKDLAYVFDRFYRVDKSRSRQVMGSGLGLSIVKLIVELHLGEINIQSKEGEGTMVMVTLPQAGFSP